jgi:hypothetical protein
MVVLTYRHDVLPRRSPPRPAVSRRRPDPTRNRLPLGTFTQGRSRRRATLECVATTAALAGAIAGFLALQWALGLP